MTETPQPTPEQSPPPSGETRARPPRLRAAPAIAVIVAQVAAAAAIAAFALRTTKHPSTFDQHSWIVFEDVISNTVLALIGATIVYVFRARLRTFIAHVPRWAIDLVVFAVAFGFTAHVTIKAFGATPQIQDEIAYDLIGRRMAAWDPIPKSHAFPEFFRLRFMVDDGHNYPLFQPGWPLVLAFFHKLRIPQYGPAFAVATLVVFSSRLAERLYGRYVGLLAAVLLVGSGFLQIVGGAYFAHAWAAALIVASLDQLFATLDEDRPKWITAHAIAGGLFAAWLVVTRIPAALTLAVAIIVTAAIHGVRWSPVLARKRPELVERAKRPLVVFAIAAMLGPLGQAGWNLATTHNPVQLPQDKYFDLTEPVKNCHRIGFGQGIGCPREHPPEVRPEGYTLARAVEVSAIRWNVFRTDTWGTAWPLALAGLFFLRRLRARDAIVLIGTFGPIVVYFGFYYHALQHGARLWADMLGPLAIMIAAGAAGPFDETEPVASKPRGILAIAAVALVFVVVADEWTRDIPERVASIGKGSQAQRVSAALDAGGVTGKSLIFMANCIETDRMDVMLGWSSVINATPPDQGDRIVVHDFGREHDAQLAALYPDRKTFRVDCNGHPYAVDDVKPTPGVQITEMEAKFPPDAREGCYASIKEWPGASNRTALDIRVTQPNAWARFRQHVLEAGRYELTVSYARRTDGARFVVVVDGAPPEGAPIETRGVAGIMTWTAAPRDLSAGTHTIEVRAVGATGVSYLTIDRIELRRR